MAKDSELGFSSLIKGPETGSQFFARLKDPLRWRSAVYDLVVWFMFGIVLTTFVAQVTPGYPILVGTPSIATGLYWLNKQDKQFLPGDFVTFTFSPQQAWIAGRYGQGVTHTKVVRGVPGDTVYADSMGRLKVCRPSFGLELMAVCLKSGTPMGQDSKARPMTAWLSPGHQYTLKVGELWVYAPNERSLDSRYTGPEPLSQVHGKAHLLVKFSDAPADPGL
jgi:type IV secretory pathway protease TraF